MENASLNKKSFVLHPFLFSCLPVLMLLSFNTTEIPVQEFFIPLAISISLSFVFWIVLRYFLKGKKAGLVLSLIILLFVISGNVTQLLPQDDGEISPFPSQFVLMLIILIVGIFGTIFLIKTKFSHELNSIFNVVAVTIFIILVSLFLLYSIENSNISNTNFVDYVEVPLMINQIEKKPNVFLLIFDEFGGEKQMQMDFDYDLTQFREELVKRDFFVPEQSFSNYPNTVFSLPSFLNMNYVDNLVDDLGSDSKDHRIVSQLISENNIMKIFKAYGYSVTVFANGYGEKYEVPSSSPYIDEKLCVKNSNIINTRILHNVVSTYFPITPTSDLYFQVKGESILQQFDECMFSYILNYKLDKEQPHFVSLHVMLPHGGYRYDSDGNTVFRDPGIEVDKEGYFNQLLFTEKRSLELIDSIQKESPDSVIIVVSDHGWRPEINWGDPTDKDLIRGFDNIIMIHFPDKEVVLPETISLVNVFRIFFNTYFDTDYEILKNKHVWYNSEPFVHIDMTEKLNTLIDE